MKLAELLIVTCCWTVVRSESTGTKEQTLQERASAQLERLSPYRRTTDQNGSSAVPRDAPRYQSNDIETQRSYDEQRFALEFFQLLPRDMQEQIIATKRIDRSIEDRLVTDVLADPRKAQMMQDRIKRSGSGSFVSNLAGGIVGGIASASAGASRGSSTPQQPHSYATTYGVPEQAYGHQTFDVWDFKRAILNTLLQALKAISGGVLALKGQIIKGSGFLISTKGRLISSTGEAITSLGRQIASSAVVSPPKTEYSNGGYSYEPPTISHDTYDGPPPGNAEYTSSDDYSGHTSYAPSDVDDQAGLLLVKPTKPELDNHDDFSVDLNPRQQPNLSDLEDSFGGPSKDQASKDLLCNLSSASSISTPTSNSGATPPCANQENHGESYNSFEHPPPSYNSQNDYYTYTIEGDKNANVQHYQSFEESTKNSYQSNSANIKPEDNSYNLGNDLSIQHNVEYSPIHLQQVQYSSPQKDSSSSYVNLPKGQYGSNLNSLSLYSNPNSLTTGTTIQVDTIKLPILNHHSLPEIQKYQTSYNGAGSYGESSLYGAPSYGNIQAGVHSSEPLKIPILHPPLEQYWQTYTGHGLQKRNGHSRRRFASKVKRMTPYIYYDRRLRRG